MSFAIEISELCVEFQTRRGVVRALDRLSLQVEQGRVFGLLGPNGAGKTTTMHVLLGFLPPTSGWVRIFGQDSTGTLSRARLGYMPEHAETYRFLTGRELLYAAGRLFGMGGARLRERVEELLELVGLSEAADRRIAAYSRGMVQRIGLAQALVNDPDLVILDEPTSGFDPIGRVQVRSIIARLRDRGKTVFFSSHELSEVELVCDTIGIVAAGRLRAQGAVQDLVKSGQSLERYFLEIVGGQ